MSRIGSLSKTAPVDNKQTTWHCNSSEDLIQQLNSNRQIGLSSAEAQLRLVRDGANTIQETASQTPLQIFIAQFTDFMILVLLAAAVVSGVVGEPRDTIAILVIVTLNAVIGAVQEYRAERSIAALKKLVAADAQVLRDASTKTIAANQLVSGDIVMLQAGDAIPADLRLLETAQLSIDESALTGESQTVAKHSETLDDPALAVADQTNMAFKGTLVTGGRGIGLVVATGMTTELGQIASLLGQEALGQTPLQQRLAYFGRGLAIAVLIICALLFMLGLLRGEPLLLMFMTAVSLAVAAIPEALPAVVTVSLALGAAKMSRRNALVRRLPAVETLGSVTFICSDKTGTLTENRMRVEAIMVADRRESSIPSSLADQKPWLLLGQALSISNDASVREDGSLAGDPTEIALVLAAQAAGFDQAKLRDQLPRVNEIPFDSERKRMSTLHHSDADESTFMFIKGAPEQVLICCDNVLSIDGTVELNRETVLQQAEQLASEGYRVLAFAYRSCDQNAASEATVELERDLSLLGLVAMIDPPRAEASAAVANCQNAGIVPVMITGDHPGTALAIAERVGIASDGVMTGQELERLSAAELQQRVADIRVYARVDPAQKIKIVKALQDNGEFVAMTGDGVNDAPALKRADIGVAMGLKGTDVAREAADMVLLDDNFATIVTAVSAGRRIFDNIRKFVKYTMTSNAGEILTLALAPLLGLPIPLLPIQILWINLVTDGLPGLALAAEPAERGLMARPPRPPNESIFAHGLWQHVVWCGLLIGLLSVATQAWAYGSGREHWQTMVFTVLTLSQLAHALAIRSDRDSLLRQGLLSNRPLLGAVILTLGLQLAVIYLPFFQPIFNTAPLSLAELAICLVLPLVVFFAVEVEKALVRRGWIYAQSKKIR